MVEYTYRYIRGGLFEENIYRFWNEHGNTESILTFSAALNIDFSTSLKFSPKLLIRSFISYLLILAICVLEWEEGHYIQKQKS